MFSPGAILTPIITGKKDMPTYRRTTRLCSPEELRPELARLVEAHLRAHPGEVLLCCETTADKIEGARFSAWSDDTRDTHSCLALVLTPDRLIWARSGDHTAPGCHFVRLINVRIKITHPWKSNDFAVDVYGRMADTKTITGGKLTLGPGPEAERFCVAVGEAMEHYNPTRKSKWPKWWPGQS